MLLRSPFPPTPWTCTGTALEVLNDPVPSWPSSPTPQAQSVPPLLIATMCCAQTPIAVTPVSTPTPPGPTTWTGVWLFENDPFPSSPVLRLPHVQTVPSLLSAAEK